MSDKNPFVNIVDHFFVLTHTRYQKRRIAIENELRRLSISKYDVIVQFPTPYDEDILKHLKHEKGVDVRAINIWKNHYRAIKTGYEYGYDRIMLIEDDASFLKDTSLIKNIADEAPRDYSMLQLDSVVTKLSEYQKGIDIAKSEGLKYWGRTFGGECSWLRSTGCYCLSRIGMKTLIDLYEEQSTGRKGTHEIVAADMYYSALYQKTGIPIYYAVPNISTQFLYEDISQNGFFTDYGRRKYIRAGIKIQEYYNLNSKE